MPNTIKPASNKKAGTRPTSGKIQDFCYLGAPQSNYLLRPRSKPAILPLTQPAPSMGEAGLPGGPVCFWRSGSPSRAPSRPQTNPLAPGAGAGNGIRTRDTKLGKLVLYQLSYARSMLLGIKIRAASQGVFKCNPRTTRRCPLHADGKSPRCTWCSGPGMAPGRCRTGVPG